MVRNPRNSGLFTRRTALAGLAAAACGIAESARRRAAAGENIGPLFSPSGPDAAHYGAAEGYPIADPALGFHPGAPLEPKYRVGAFSHGDELFPTRRIARAASPWMFKRSQVDFRYRFRGNPSSPAEYMSRNPVTGLLIAKDDEILFESYQYGRTDRDRFFSGSMVKTIAGMLLGIAVSEGAIKSVDDTPDGYVPGFKGTEYGKTDSRSASHVLRR